MDLAVEVYSLTRGFPNEERFGLTNQLRRAAVSISSNIAEGQSRLSTREFIQFLSIARGSNGEVQSQLLLSRRLGYAEEAAFSTPEALSAEVGKMLHALIARLRQPRPTNS